MVDHLFFHCKVPTSSLYHAAASNWRAMNRVNESLLRPLERRALAWAVVRIPAWVLPDHLTGLGLLGALGAGAGYILSRWSLPWLWLANLGLLAHWFGDSLDGSLARHRRIERPRYGFFVDESSDVLSQTIMFLCLGLSPCTHFAVACLGLIAYQMAMTYSLIVLQVRKTAYIAFFGFGPTEIRALLVFGNLWVLCFGILDLRPWLKALAVPVPVTIHDVIVSLLAVLGAAALAFSALQERRALSLEEPPPSATLETPAP
jgi:phosphatidylglycerophosphate synthase